MRSKHLPPRCVTVYETIVSFLLVIFIALLCAVLLWFSPKLSEIMEPYLVVLNSLPKICTSTPSDRMARRHSNNDHCLWNVCCNLWKYFKPIYKLSYCRSREKSKLIYTLHGTRFHALTKVVIPHSIPAIISNMKVNIGLCLVGVIIGEFLAARNGLGYLIIYSSQVFKLDWLLMAIVLLCILAMFLYACINLLEKLYLGKRHS